MNTHLILHKVRGQPEFDMAEEIQIGDEVGWITTAGHRAYPYHTWKLEDLHDHSDIDSNGSSIRPWIMDKVPDDWPDHYGVDASPPPPDFNINAFVSSLMKPFPRRA